MSYFGKNIRKIRNAKKISQAAFADLFDLKRGSISAYEEGRAEAKIDTIIEIAGYFQLTLDQLLRKELTINEIYHIRERGLKLQQRTKNEEESLSNQKAISKPSEHLKQVRIYQEVINKIEIKLNKIEERLVEIEKRLM